MVSEMSEPTAQQRIVSQIMQVRQRQWQTKSNTQVQTESMLAVMIKMAVVAVVAMVTMMTMVAVCDKAMEDEWWPAFQCVTDQLSRDNGSTD